MAEAQRRTVTLTDVAFGGDCLARVDNRILFASYGLPGEEVVVALTESKRDYQRGRVVEVIAPSAARVEPRCPLFGRCGGCRWQHVDYAMQTEMKRKVVADQLRRIGGFGDTVAVNPTLGAEHPWEYRNHVRFSVRQGRLGFLEEESNRFLAVDHCDILHPAIGEVSASLQGRLPKHLDHLVVRYGVNTGQLLIHPDPRRGHNDAKQFSDRRGAVGAKHLPDSCQTVSRHQPQMLRPYATNAYRGHSESAVEEELLGRRFRVNAESFFQVNTPQAGRLIAYAIGQLQPQASDTLLDIYCGVGTFGLLAAGKVGRVIGVEESGVALQDARHNARDLANVSFVEGAAEDVMGNLREHVDVAIIDPPRAGCKREVVEALRRLAPGKIVYVSCDPATLARDLKLLCADQQYAVADVQPVDMFPQTYHIETVVTLTRG